MGIDITGDVGEGKRPKDYARPETLRDLSELKLYLEVDQGDSDTSGLSLVSFGYRRCNAIALMNGDKAGLCHTAPEGDNILYDAEKMVEDLGVPPKKLKAILVAGAGMETMEKYCKKLGIEVVNSYQGDWYYDCDDKRLFYPRDVLLVPSSREVIIYTREGKIHKLFDPFSDFSESKPYPNLLEREFSFWAL